MLSQTSKALDLGATPAEMFETCSTAISMGAFNENHRPAILDEAIRLVDAVEPTFRGDGTIASLLFQPANTATRHKTHAVALSPGGFITVSLSFSCIDPMLQLCTLRQPAITIHT